MTYLHAVERKARYFYFYSLGHFTWCKKEKYYNNKKISAELWEKIDLKTYIEKNVRCVLHDN